MMDKEKMIKAMRNVLNGIDPKVNVDSNEYTYTTGSEITFETGHVYTFTLNFTGVNISTGNL